MDAGYNDGEDGSSAPLSKRIAEGSSSAIMTTVSRHYFGFSSDDEANGDCGAFFIDIMENIQEEYGMFIWPCSIVLAEYVWQQKERFSGKYVVELGAGTSLPGLVAARVGANVMLTDSSNKLEVLDNMRKTCDLNKIQCDISGITWGEWDESLFSLNPSILLGADVLYDTTAFEDLFVTVTFLLRKSPGSVFITSYHNRSGHHLIEYLMVKWGWKCVKLVDAFSFMPMSKTAKLQGNIQLVEIMLDDERNE